MGSEILVPEELIINNLFNAFQNDLAVLIEEINQEKSEIWLEPFHKIKKGFCSSEDTRRPLCLIHLEKAARKSSDLFVEAATYTLVIKVLLHHLSPVHRIFRYAALLQRFLRENPTLVSLWDQIYPEEYLYYESEGKFLYRIVREDLS